MLQKIRDKISGWIAGVVIALVGGAFVFWGVDFYFEGNAGNQNIAATVNGTKITDNEVNELFTQLQRQMSAQTSGALNADMLAQLKSYALQSSITNTALFTTLQKDGYRVSIPQVELIVSQVPQFQINGQFSQEKLMQLLAQQNLTPMQFFQRIQSEILINQAVNGVAATAFALPDEVNQAYSLMHQSRSFGYLIIPINTFLSKTVVSDQDIQNYYKQHQSVFMSPAKVKVSYLELSPETIAKTVSVTQDQAKQYFDTHSFNFQKKTFSEVEKNIMALLQHQKVADILNKQSSELADITYTNPSSLMAASKTLSLPIQTSDWITQAGEKTGLLSDPKILTTIFSDSVLQQGNNSNPVSLPDGSQVVIRVDQKQLSQAISLAQVKAQIKQQLAKKQAAAEAGLLAYQLQTKLAAGESAETLAQKNGLVWKVVPMTTQQGKNPAVSTEILAAAFSSKSINTTELKSGGYAVISVLKISNADISTASSTEKVQLQQQLSALWAQLTQHFYVGSVVNGSKIKLKTN